MKECSFCGKSEEKVEVLIAGPDVYICDECVSLCQDVLMENRISKIIDKLIKEAGKQGEAKP